MLDHQGREETWDGCRHVLSAHQWNILSETGSGSFGTKGNAPYVITVAKRLAMRCVHYCCIHVNTARVCCSLTNYTAHMITSHSGRAAVVFPHFSALHGPVAVLTQGPHGTFKSWKMCWGCTYACSKGHPTGTVQCSRNRQRAWSMACSAGCSVSPTAAWWWSPFRTTRTGRGARPCACARGAPWW